MIDEELRPWLDLIWLVAVFGSAILAGDWLAKVSYVIEAKR